MPMANKSDYDNDDFSISPCTLWEIGDLKIRDNFDKIGGPPLAWSIQCSLHQQKHVWYMFIIDKSFNGSKCYGFLLLAK